MIIIKTKQYTKDLKKYIINKHKTKELIRINNIEEIEFLNIDETHYGEG